MKEITDVTRFEVIDHTDNGKGRDFYFDNRGSGKPFKVEVHVQDGGRTVKVFLSEKKN